jgi:hypothetical protein
MTHKRGQNASNAAAFVAVITVLIILYILFLPPDIRTELLGDKNSILQNGSGSSANTQVLLKQSVGQVTYINTNEKTYDLPAIKIYSPTSGQVLKNVPSALVKYPIFDSTKSKYTVELNIDRAATKNVLLSFNVVDHKGPLIITLNGQEIFNAEITTSNPKPIILNHEDLMDSNNIVFSVPSPGLRFWSANSYSIEALQITGDVTDYTNALGVQNFVISSVEKDNLESIKLYFYPSCSIKDVGSLNIEFNRMPIYNSLADCGVKTTITLSTDEVLAGNNELRFYSSKGSYTLDNMYIKTTMNKPAYKTYYFDMSEDYFDVKNSKARCGDYDGLCPSGCDETQDADCCFSRNGYWCSLPTLDSNDRCRFYVSSDNCVTCKTGYYDRSGDSPTNCEETCGDNNDDKCNSDCIQPSRYYDKDCCFAQDADNYWCEETPITGIADKCKPSISPGDCDLCPSGYVNTDGSRPDSCNQADFNIQDEDYILSDNYELKIIVRFTDDTTRKRVDFNINGHTFRIDTTGVEYTKIIDDFARIGTNSIEILPVDKDITIAEVRVDLKKVN